jgi:acylpyruvate hydrolase
MKFVKFIHQGLERYGQLTDNGIRSYPLTFDPWQKNFDTKFRHTHFLQKTMDPSAVTFLPPMRKTGKIICVGLNYMDHAKEGGHANPISPAIFLRVPSSITGHDQPLIKPKESDRFDYEAELAVIIGQKIRRAPQATALDAVLGYTCFNDGSLRDYQRRSGALYCHGGCIA